MTQLDRIEKKFDRLLTRKRQQGHRYRKEISQLKADKIALLRYIKELESFLKVQTEDDKEI